MSAKIELHHDSDDGGGPELGCLECKGVARSRWTFSNIYLVYELICDECGDVIVKEDKLYGGVYGSKR